MKCNACNAAKDQGANQVFQCDSCREIFVAIEQDHATQQVLEAAFEWGSGNEGFRFRRKVLQRIYEAVKAHPDFKGKKRS